MNANNLISTENLSNEEWLEWRKKGIGGSDASVVCGLSRWKSPVELWMEKTDQLESKAAGEAAYWGTLLEPVVRNEFIKRASLPVTEVKQILQHPKHSFMLANVDGIIEHPELGKGIFEAKTANEFAAKDWENGIPDEYMLQVQHYLAVTDLAYAYISVLIGGNKYLWKFIERDQELIEMLIRMESAFWKSVETFTPPAFDGSDGSTELLNRLYPLGKDSDVLTLPSDAEELISDYEKYQAEEKEIAGKKNSAANKLKAMLGEHERGISGSRTVSWKSVLSEKFNSKALKEEKPDIFSQYISQSSYRRFSVK